MIPAAVILAFSLWPAHVFTVCPGAQMPGEMTVTIHFVPQARLPVLCPPRPDDIAKGPVWGCATADERGAPVVVLPTPWSAETTPQGQVDDLWHELCHIARARAGHDGFSYDAK